MKSVWLIAALAGTILTSPAYAQVTSGSASDSNANSNAASTAVNAPVNNGNGNSSSSSKSGSISGSNSASYSAGGSGYSSASASQGNSQAAIVNNNTPSNQTIRTVPAIVAPALTTTLTETCMGSTSLGVSVVGVGATGATTWNDGECVRRLNARELNSMGFHTEACYVLRVDRDVDASFEKSGNRCDNWVQPGSAAQGGGSAANPPWGAHSANGAPPAS